MSKVDPEDTRMELTCICTKFATMYFEERSGREAMEKFVYETKMNLEYIRDANNRMSFGYFCRFLRKLVEHSGNPNAPFEAGVYQSEKLCQGAFQAVAKRFVTVASTYRFFVQLAPRFGTVAEFRMLELSRNACTISVQNHKYPQDKNNCLCTQGVLASAPRNFGLPLAQVDELECACDGHDACVYRITWVNKPERMWGALGFAVGLLLGALACVSATWSTAGLVTMLLLAMLGYFMGREKDYKTRLKEVYSHNEEQAESLHKSLKDIEKLNEGLQATVEMRMEEIKKSNDDLGETLRELEESQEKVLVAEKQAAIGVLASGMAHEMNSPINAIRLSTQGLREDLGSDSELLPQVEVVERATDRCKRIINDLLSFSREPRRETSVRIEEILESTLIAFENEYDGGVDIIRNVQSGLPRLTLDRMQTYQAIHNLLTNASDALEGRGQIRVSLTSDSKEVVLSVSDDGPGMNEATRRRIFDPFYTTKASGKGTGLGLSIAYQLVKRNNGTIEVHSGEGRGATFTIRFPVAT